MVTALNVYVALPSLCSVLNADFISTKFLTSEDFLEEKEQPELES